MATQRAPRAYLSVFGQTAQHGDERAVLLPHHLPEVGDRDLHATLRRDVPALTTR